MNIKKAILRVTSANFLQLVVSIIVGFVVPNILSIESYADLKTYTLYITYVGLLHFGFVDGLYLKYGGKKYNELNLGEIKSEHNFLVIFQLIITAILMLIALMLKNVVFVLFCVSILPIMVSAFFKYIYQATGEFKKYTRILYIYSLSYLLIIIFLTFILKSNNYIYYCLAMIISNVISVFFVELSFIKSTCKIKSVKSDSYIPIMKRGFLILLGNLSVVGLYGIDKWFIKLFFSTETFAFYSFSVSLLNIINILIGAISVTFYNYLFTHKSEDDIYKLKRVLTSVGAFASSAYFVLAIIIKFWLKKYIGSLSIISITFAILPCMILFNSLYSNLYKVNKNEKKYFKIVFCMFIVSIIYNFIALIFNSANCIALATIITLYTCIIFMSKDLKITKDNVNIYLYIFLCNLIFIYSSHLSNVIIGFVIYFSSFVILSVLFKTLKLKDVLSVFK